MTNEQIEAFLAVVETGTFARASEALFVKQSTLGYRIGELENELGVALFLRGRGVRRVELTERGRAFAPLAREWRDLNERIADAMKGGGGDDSPIVLYVAHSLVEFSPDVLAYVSERCSTAVHVFPLVPDMDKIIETGVMDFAITGSSARNPLVADEIIARERFVLVSNAYSDLPDHVEVGRLDPRDEVFIPWNAPLDIWHQRAFGAHFSPCTYAASTFTAAGLLSSTKNAWAVLSLNYALALLDSGAIKLHEVSLALPSRDIHLWSRRPVKMPVHDWLIEGLKTRIKNAPGVTVL